MELLGGIQLAGYLQPEDVSLPSANWPLLTSWNTPADPSSKMNQDKADHSSDLYF